MAKKELSMYESATQKLRVSRNGAVTMLVVDGQGAACVPTADFSVVEKWARSKTAAPNTFLSMSKVLEKLEIAIARPGTTFASTRGSGKYVADLAKVMKAAGFDMGEWALPPDVKDILSGKVKEGPKPMKPKTDDPGAGPDPDAST